MVDALVKTKPLLVLISKLLIPLKIIVGYKMAKYSTNSLLDLCRFGISLKNEQTDTAARELASYIVFASVLDYETNLPEELESRMSTLVDAKTDLEQGTGKYPRDMFDEEEAPTPDEPGPLVA